MKLVASPVPAEVLQYLPDTVEQYQVAKGTMMKINDTWVLVILDQTTPLSPPYVSPKSALIRDLAAQHGFEVVDMPEVANPMQLIADFAAAFGLDVDLNPKSTRFSETIKTDTMPAERVAKIDFFAAGEQSIEETLSNSIRISNAIMAILDNRWSSSTRIGAKVMQLLPNIKAQEVWPILFQLWRTGKVQRVKLAVEGSRNRIFHYKI